MKKIILVSLVFFLTSCSSTGIMRNGRYVGHYKVGNPYKINKIKYTPKEVSSYYAKGVASWYGPGFHGQKTANGETYNKYALTAAHPTLPLPCMVRVTNLGNNKSVVVRVTDRGPFVKKKLGRIIDLSQKAAEVLGMKEKGIAKVSVKLLPEATKKLHKILNINQGKVLYASNTERVF